jgi:hypothetical protein
MFRFIELESFDWLFKCVKNWKLCLIAQLWWKLEALFVVKLEALIVNWKLLNSLIILVEIGSFVCGENWKR